MANGRASRAGSEDKEINSPKRRRLRKSALRKTLAKLQELEPYALKLIEKSVKEEKDFDKDSLATSKWLVQNLMALTKAAISDEESMNGLRLKMNAQADTEDNEQEEEEKPTGAVFSLFVNEAAKKDK